MSSRQYKLQRDKLALAARALAQIKRGELLALKKQHADLKRNDFLWHYLLQSFATMGGASGKAGLIDNKRNYRQVKFNALSKVPAHRRAAHVSRVCAAAGVRYPPTKGKYISACYIECKEMGGPKAARDKLLSLRGRAAKLAFLQSFTGVGEKYARNIMMDVYHEEFRECIAIDSRITKISEKWNLNFCSYKEHESFYLEVAKAASLNGWELDRLMFHHSSVFMPPITNP